MFVIKTVLRNIGNNCLRCILAAAACALITALTVVYGGFIDANDAALKQLSESVTVTAQICNPTGSQTIGLQIPGERIGRIMETGMVKDLHYTVGMAADSVPVKETDAIPEFKVMGINDVECLGKNAADMVNYTAGYSAEDFRTNEAVCIVSENILNKSGFTERGGKVELAIYYFDYGENFLQYRYIGEYEAAVMGTYDPAFAEGETADIIFPIGFLKQTYADAQESFMADSAEFTLADPAELNEFKSKMKEIGFMSISASGAETITGSALVVNDRTYISSAQALERNIGILRAMMPVVYVVFTMVGFVIFRLFCMMKQPEILLMRSVGISKRKCLTMLLAESLLIALIGILTGFAAAGLFQPVGLLGKTAILMILPIGAIVAAIIQMIKS